MQIELNPTIGRCTPLWHIDQLNRLEQLGVFCADCITCLHTIMKIIKNNMLHYSTKYAINLQLST